MNYLTYLPVWDNLQLDEQRKLANASTLRKVKKGEILHGGNWECTGLILVISGQLRAYTESEEGREITVYRLFQRDSCLFSATCIMNSLQFEMTVSAEKDSEILIIAPDVYKNIMEVSALLANYTNEVMASRFSEVMWLIDQIMWKSFDTRLAEFLLKEMEIEESPVLHITHETIGNHLGSPREVITRMLKYFVSEGLVSLSRGTVTIINEKGLSRLLG